MLYNVAVCFISTKFGKWYGTPVYMKKKTQLILRKALAKTHFIMGLQSEN